MEIKEIDHRILDLLRSVKHILDLGCGEGRLINALVRQNHRWVVGLDISNHGFSQAKQNARQAVSHHLVECVEGDAQRIAFKDNHFERVILTFSLHHFERPNLAMKDIHQLSHPSSIRSPLNRRIPAARHAPPGRGGAR